MSIFARINRLQYVTRFYGRKLPRHFYFQDPNARSRQSKRRFLFSKLCSKLGSSKKENISLVTISFRTSFRRSFANVARRRRKKLGRDLTLSPRCIPTFAAGPSGKVHITYANVRPSVPVLPPTTLRPKPAAVKLNKLSV